MTFKGPSNLNYLMNKWTDEYWEGQDCLHAQSSTPRALETCGILAISEREILSARNILQILSARNELFIQYQWNVTMPASPRSLLEFCHHAEYSPPKLQKAKEIKGIINKKPDLFALT